MLQPSFIIIFLHQSHLNKRLNERGFSRVNPVGSCFVNITGSRVFAIAQVNLARRYFSFKAGPGVRDPNMAGRGFFSAAHDRIALFHYIFFSRIFLLSFPLSYIIYLAISLSIYLLYLFHRFIRTFV